MRAVRSLTVGGSNQIERKCILFGDAFVLSRMPQLSSIEGNNLDVFRTMPRHAAC